MYDPFDISTGPLAGWRVVDNAPMTRPSRWSWQDTAQYVQNQPYQLEVTVQGPTITVSLDGVQLYSGKDNSHLRGSIGLYAWASGARRSTTSRSRT